MAAVHNLYIDQGADFSAEIGIYDDFNTPWDLNGYTGEAKLRKSYYSSSFHEFDVFVTPDGMVTLTMSSTTTASVEQGRYLYDVVITSAAGKKTRVIEGLVTINPGVTK
jgi:hypothetical protein